MTNLNFLAILVAGVAGMLIGQLYYSSASLGKQWKKLIGTHKKNLEKEQKKNRGKIIVVAFLAQLLIALVLLVVSHLFSPTIVGGLLTGLLSWSGFVLTTSVSDVLWEGKKSGLWILHNGYRLISFLIMGVIVAVWV